MNQVGLSDKNRFINTGIIKSLVTAISILSLIGFFIGCYNEYFNKEFKFGEIYVNESNYSYIAVTIIILVYIVQVAFLQKSESNHEKIGINVFSLTGTIVILIKTNFGLTGVVSSSYYETQESFILKDELTALILITLILLSLIVVIIPSDTFYIVLIILSSIYIFLLTEVMILPLVLPVIYIFAYIVNHKSLQNKIIGMPEILFLAVCSVLSIIVLIINQIISVMYSDILNTVYFIIYLMSAAVSCILFFFSWRRNSLKMLLIAGIIKAASIFAVPIYNLITLHDLGMGIPEVFDLQLFMDMIITPQAILFIVAAWKLKHVSKFSFESNNNVINLFNKKRSFTLVIMTVIYITSLLIYFILLSFKWLI